MRGIKQLSLIFLCVFAVAVVLWKVSDEVRAGDFTIGSSGETVTIGGDTLHSKLGPGKVIYADQYDSLGAAVAALGGYVRKLIIPGGTYSISTQLTPPSHTIIEGVGDSTILVAGDSANVFYLSGKSNIAIHGLAIRGDGITSYSDVDLHNGIFMSNCSDITIENCAFDSVTWNAIRLDNSSNCTIRNNRLDGNLWGGGINGVDGYGSADIRLNHNCYGNKIINNWCLSANGVGITLNTSTTALHDNLISGNTIRNHGRYGIMIYNSAATDSCWGNQIINNNIQETTSDTSTVGIYDYGMGIYVLDAAYTTIANNTLKRNCLLNEAAGSLPEGAITVNTSKGCVVTGNRVWESTGDGITISTSDSCTVGSNTVSGSGASGIKVVQSGGVSITGNTLTGNSEPGIYIAGTTGTWGHDSVVSGNICRGNGNQGILLYRNRGTLVTGNSLIDNAHDGVALNTASDCQITTNLIADNDTANVGYKGISVGSSSDKNYIFGNNIFNTNSAKGHNYGISVVGDSNRVSLNQIRDSRTEDYYDGGTNTFGSQAWGFLNVFPDTVAAGDSVLGNFFFNSVDSTLKVWDGTTWQDCYTR